VRVLNENASWYTTVVMVGPLKRENKEFILRFLGDTDPTEGITGL
jgi:hypothetical protein